VADTLDYAQFPAAPLGSQGGFAGVRAWRRRELAIGVSSALAASVFACFPWSLALVGGLTIVGLAAAENEPFILTVIFLIPVGWIVNSDFPIKNVSVAIRILVLAGFFLGRLMRGKLSGRELLRPSITRASLLFLCLAVGSNAWGGIGWSHESWRSVYDLAAFIGFFMMLLTWMDSRRRIRTVLAILLYSAMGTAVFAIAQEVAGGYTSLWLYLSPSGDEFDRWASRAPSFLNYSNSLAGYLDLILPFALACCLLGKGRWKQLGGWATGLGVLALLCTQSLGGLAGFVAILILAVTCLAGSQRRRVILLTGICAAVFLVYAQRGILSPAHTEEALGPDAMMRLLLWGTAWDLFLKSPVFGVGWGNFINLYGSYLTAFSDWIKPGVFGIHNIYLQLLAETGVAGCTSFFYLVVQVWRQAWGQWRSSFDYLDRALAFGVMGALVSVLVHGLVDFLFQVSPQFGTLFWVLLALLVANGRLASWTEKGRPGA